jgi:hypothetical protein
MNGRQHREIVEDNDSYIQQINGLKQEVKQLRQGDNNTIHDLEDQLDEAINKRVAMERRIDLMKKIMEKAGCEKNLRGAWTKLVAVVFQ